MASNTGWQIVNAVMSVSPSGEPIDADGHVCNVRDASTGVMVSITGKKQRVYLRSGVSSSSIPLGATYSYAFLYDAVSNAYSIPTNLPDPTVSSTYYTTVSNVQVAVAYYKGYSGQECQAELFEFSLPKTSSTIPALYITDHPNAGMISIPVTSKYLNNFQPFTATIESVTPNQTNHGVSIYRIDTANSRILLDVTNGYTGRQTIDSDQQIRIKITQTGSNRVLYYTLIRKARVKMTTLQLEVTCKDIQGYLYTHIYNPVTTSSNFPTNYPQGNASTANFREFLDQSNNKVITKTFAQLGIGTVMWEGDSICLGFEITTQDYPEGTSLIAYNSDQYDEPYYQDLKIARVVSTTSGGIQNMSTYTILNSNVGVGVGTNLFRSLGDQNYEETPVLVQATQRMSQYGDGIMRVIIEIA